MAKGEGLLFSCYYSEHGKHGIKLFVEVSQLYAGGGEGDHFVSCGSDHSSPSSHVYEETVVKAYLRWALGCRTSCLLLGSPMLW